MACAFRVGRTIRDDKEMTYWILRLHWGVWKETGERWLCRFAVALWTRVTLGLGMCKVCTEAVDCVALWTRVTLGLDMCKVCTEAVDCVALWTRVTSGLGMCKVCTEAVDCVALWTRVTLGLGMCKVCTEAVDCVALWTRVTLGLDMCKVCTEGVDCVALWTRVTLGLGMCKVCTEAVDCVALWTRVTWGLGMCKVCTEGVDCVALWTRVTLGLDMCKVCNEAMHMAKSRKRVPRVSKWTKKHFLWGRWQDFTCNRGQNRRSAAFSAGKLSEIFRVEFEQTLHVSDMFCSACDKPATWNLARVKGEWLDQEKGENHRIRCCSFFSWSSHSPLSDMEDG